MWWLENKQIRAVWGLENKHFRGVWGCRFQWLCSGSSGSPLGRFTSGVGVAMGRPSMTTGVHSISCNAVKQLAREVGRYQGITQTVSSKLKGVSDWLFYIQSMTKQQWLLKYTSSHDKVERFAMLQCGRMLHVFLKLAPLNIENPSFVI